MALTSSSLFPSATEADAAAARGVAVAPYGFERIDGAGWDRLVSGFDGVCQEQLFTYARLRWPGTALEPLVFYDGAEVVGGVLVMVQRLPLGVAGIAVVKWGPVLADGTRPDAGEAMARMVETLVAEYADRRAMMVSIMPRVEPGPVNRFEALLLERGFASGSGVRYPLRYLVDLSLSPEARMAAFAQKWRYNLRKSFKAGLVFRHAGPGETDAFMGLYNAMSARKLFPDHSGIDTLPALMAMPEGTARPDLFLVEHDGRPVAGAAIFSAGDMACYLYGATDDSALALRAGYFIHWHVMAWLGEHTRARYYDLGGTDGFAGLHQFKSGMVGEGGSIAPLPPMLNYVVSRRAWLAGTAAYKGREWLTRGRDAIEEARLKFKRRDRS